jgi:hypothetical protein
LGGRRTLSELAARQRKLRQSPLSFFVGFELDAEAGNRGQPRDAAKERLTGRAKICVHRHCSYSYRVDTRSPWRSRSAKASTISNRASDAFGRRSCNASRASRAIVSSSSLTLTLGAVDIDRPLAHATKATLASEAKASNAPTLATPSWNIVPHCPQI